MERTFVAPEGEFELRRHPERPRSTLRAWDAGDAYALRWLAENPARGPVAVINDGFGALAAGLHSLNPSVLADSISSRIGIAANLERNGLAAVAIGGDIEELPEALGLVVIKVPKSLGQLEEQLHRLRPKLTATTIVLGAGMVKQIHTSTLQLFEAILGPTTTSLAERKARLIHCTVDPGLSAADNPWPMTWRTHGMTVVNRGGVFSARSLDIGARFMMENLPAPSVAASAAFSAADLTGARIVDLGCGNGVLGTAIAAANPSCQPSFIDVSTAAIDSARQTWSATMADRPATFHLAERMVEVIDRSSVDLVLNNPPFHDDHVVGDDAALAMFVDAHRVLRPGGELRVVANRHLGHHAKLERVFGNHETVGSTKKFVVLSAIKAAIKAG